MLQFLLDEVLQDYRRVVFWVELQALVKFRCRLNPVSLLVEAEGLHVLDLPGFEIGTLGVNYQRANLW